MNLSRAPPQEKINICRKYFLAGIPLLPWIWIVNILWFWKYAYKPDHIPQVRKYVILSAIGATLYVAAIGIWIGIYQNKRVSWGGLGDRISLNVPLGYP